MDRNRTKRVVMVGVVGLVGLGLLALLTRGAPEDHRKPAMYVAPEETPESASTEPVRVPQEVRGAGKGAIIDQTDPNTGRLIRQFYFDEVTPRDQGVIETKKPRMRLFLEPWRVVEMVADEGRFDAPNNNIESGVFEGNLVITVYQIDREEAEGPAPAARTTLDLSPRSPHRVLKIKLDRATFDTVQSEIRSDSPVELLTPATKRAYFRGQGLTLVYNELASRIDHLEITKGEMLRYRPETTAEKAQREAAAATRTPRDKPADADATPKKDKPEKSDESADPAQFYRVTFARQVQATSEGRTIDADSLVAYFALDKPDEKPGGDPRDKPSKPKRKETPTPSEGATSRLDAPEISCRADDAPAADEGPADPVTPVSDDPDAPLPSDRDVVLTWTGKMVMVPIDAPPTAITAARDTYLKFIGAPVVVTIEQRDRMVCQTLEYIESTTTITAMGTPAFPLRITSPQLGEIAAPMLTANTSTNKGRLDGAGTIRAAAAPAEGDRLAANAPNRLPTGFRIDWSDHVDLTFARGGPGTEAHAAPAGEALDSPASGIESATFVGDVDVEDPQMKMKADELTARFAPPVVGNNDRQLSAIDASGHVDVRFKDSSIVADRLRVETAPDESGQLAPKRVIANGRVVVIDPTQRLEADDLDVTLAKKPKPADAEKPADNRVAIDVDKAHAEGNIRLTLQSATVVRGDTLDANAADGSAVLFGSPVRIERGADAEKGLPPEAELHVKRLDLREHGKVAFAEGEGTFIYTQAATDALPRRPDPAKPAEADAPPPPAREPSRRRVRVTWTEKMNFDDRENLIQVFGSVVADAEDAGDERNKLTGDQMTLELIDPSAIEAKLEGGGTDDRKPFDAGLDRRQLRKLTARANPGKEVVLLSTKWADDTRKAIETQIRLAGPVLIFNNISEQAQVIGPGSMLVEDRRPPSATPPGTKATPMSGRGATAFTWTNRLLLDNAATDMTIEGNSHLTHQPVGKDEVIELKSDRLVADLESTTPIRALGMSRTDSLMVKRVHAVGSVQVRDRASKRVTTSDELTYNGADETILLRSEPPAKVSVIQLDNPKPLRADLIYWDLKTDTVEIREVGF